MEVWFVVGTLFVIGILVAALKNGRAQGKDGALTLAEHIRRKIQESENKADE